MMNAQIINFEERADQKKVNPQKENGYTPIANEIMDELCKLKIAATQRQCLDYILRKTYGYQKKEDQISYSQFAEATGLSVRKVRDNLKALEERKLITVHKNVHTCAQKRAYHATTYCFNKKYDEWLPQCGVHENVQRVCTKTCNTKERINYTVKSDSKSKNSCSKQKNFSDKITDFVGSFNSYVSENYPNQVPKGKPEKWAYNSSDTIDRLNRLDGFDLDYVFAVLRWAAKDDFWSTQIYSLAGLRKKSKNGLTKFQNMAAKYDRENKANNKPAPNVEYIKTPGLEIGGEA